MMNDKLPGNLSEILRFKERISAKNRQMQMLTHLSLMLSETEDEKSFVQNAVPLILQVLDTDGDLVIYIEIEGKVTSAIGLDAEDLKSIYANIRAVLTPENSPVVVDLAGEEEDDPLKFFVRRGYSKCVIASVYQKSKMIGFLMIPQDEGYVMQDDESVFIRHLGEIVGIFFNYIHLKCNLQQTKTQLENQFQNLQAVYTVSRSLGQHLDIQAILNNALDTLLSQKVLDIEAKGGIFLINEETGWLELVCHRNIGSYLEQAEKSIPLGYCLCGRVAQTGEMITSLNCFADTRHDTQFEAMQMHGHINLPLKTDKGVLGVLFLYLPGNLQPTENQVNWLTAIANQLSVAIENARLYEKVRFLSVHDPMTRLFNKKMLFDRLDEELHRMERSRRCLSVAMIDVDHFKNINDTHGHLAGDKALMELAGVLKKNVRQIDTMARFGGEEFAVLLPGANRENSVAVMERVRKAVEEFPFPIDEKGDTAFFTVSVGISTLCPGEPVEGALLVKLADEALYKAKEGGRNRVCHSFVPSG